MDNLTLGFLLIGVGVFYTLCIGFMCLYLKEKHPQVWKDLGEPVLSVSKYSSLLDGRLGKFIFKGKGVPEHDEYLNFQITAIKFLRILILVYTLVLIIIVLGFGDN